MFEIFAYAIGVMYTPGPVNLLGLHTGLNGRCRASLGFFLGVGLAMLILLLMFGWLGAELVRGDTLVYVSTLGCLYIAYLALKIAYTTVNLDPERGTVDALGFRTGLMMQLVNPKGIVATLPIATIQFPAAGIGGVALVLWSVILAALAVGAPGSYQAHLPARALQGLQPRDGVAASLRGGVDRIRVRILAAGALAQNR